MATENSSAKWWQTLPGILTAITATITATAGLIAVLHQTGLLPSFAAKQPNSTLVQPSKGQPSSGNTPTATQASPLVLPATTQVKLPVGDGNIVYTLLGAQLEAYNSESRALRFRIRALNDYSYPINFWSRSFRLSIDGVPQAPSNSLNEVLEAQSAKEGDIIFTIPANAQQAILNIGDPGQASTQIPLDLTAKPGT